MLCQGCTQFIAAGGFCLDCKNELRPVTQKSDALSESLVLYKYSGLLRRTILRAKVKNHGSALLALKALFELNPSIIELAKSADVLTPVPSSLWGRLRGRFDIAEVLVLSLATQLDKPVFTLPRKYYWSKNKRAGDNSPTFKNLTDERVFNKTIKNKSVLLIDDVLTTGFTIKKYSKVLSDLGAKQVFAAVLAYSE